jgi:hypothetical protein
MKSFKIIFKDECQFVVFITTKFKYEFIESNPKWLRYDLVREKFIAVVFFISKQNAFEVSRNDFFFSKSPKCKETKLTYNPQKTQGKPWKVKKHFKQNMFVVRRVEQHSKIQQVIDIHARLLNFMNRAKKYTLHKNRWDYVNG